MTTITQTKKTAQTSKAAQKATPAQKAATIHGLTIEMIALLDAPIAQFIGNSINGWHTKKAWIKREKSGAFVATPEGAKVYANRKGVDSARKLLQEGGKSPDYGTAYVKSPKGFPTPYIYPFSSLNGNEEGKTDSKAAFGALMLIVSGK